MPNPARLLTLLLAATMLTFTLPATTSANPDSTNGIGEQAAADWVLDAQWADEGLVTEFPEQVAFPKASHTALHTLAEHDATDLVDAPLAANAAAGLQTEIGGFDRQADDFLGPWTSATTHAILLAHEHNQTDAIDEDAAASFLIHMQNEDGGFGPRLSFFGTQPLRSSMEATHDALLALDHLDELNDTIKDDVHAYVQDQQQDDGGYPKHANTQTSSVEGTHHAVHILDKLDQLDDDTQDQAASFLHQQERPLAGGYYSDADRSPCQGQTCQLHPEVTTQSTSQALLTLDALDELDHAHQDAHEGWLSDRQEDPEHRFAGGFETYETQDAPVVDYRTNTRLALDALLTLDATSAIDHAAAVTFLADTQHEGSGGFAMWPGSHGTALDTGPATQALATLDALDQMATDAIADTYQATQRDDGSIHGPDWEHTSSTHRTSNALTALALTNQTHAIDEDAAVDFLLERQTSEGGFQETDTRTPDIPTTHAALTALAHLDRHHEANLDDAAAYLADKQDDDEGYIADTSTGYTGPWHTSLALQTLDAINKTPAINQTHAGDYLADQQHDDGTYDTPHHAAHVTLGLAALEQLDKIDEEATLDELESAQTDRGGLAERVFYTQENAMSRHATTLEALDSLDALSDEEEGCRGEDERAEHAEVGDQEGCPGQS